MSVRSRFVRVEALECRQLLSAAALAVFDSANIAPVMQSLAVGKSSVAQASATNQVITKAVGIATSTTDLELAQGQANPAVSGTQVSFTAQVNPTVPGVLPTGNVEFFDNGAMIGQSPIDTSTGSSIAFFTTVTPLALGSHPITARYDGDALYAVGPMSNVQNVVIGTGTATSLIASNSTIAPGSPGVQFTAGVTPNQMGGPAETGSVTFTADGNNVLNTTPLSNGTAVSPFITTLTAGVHSITATYSGDSNYVGSVSSPVQVTVNTPTSTTLSAMTNGQPTPPMITPGTTVTFTATVTPNPTGGLAINGDSVTFLNNGVAIGSGITNNGVATFTTSSLPNGTDNITASFPGDNTYRASSTPSALTINVGQASTTTSLVEQSPTVSVGGNATFTATVSPTVNGGPPPSGSVAFFDGATMLGSTPVFNGVATYNTTTLALGSHTIHAVYSGDPAYTTSTSNNVVEVVGIATTTTIMAAPPGPVTPGTQVTFTATVAQNPANSGPAPTGQVTFTDNGVFLGMAPVMNGAASFSTNTLPNGNHPVTATYGGDANNLASASTPVTVSVGLGSTVTPSSPNMAAALGAPVTLNVTVAPAVFGGPVPTGTVQFFDGANPVGQPATLVNGMGSIVISTLPSGSNTITGAYSGDANYTPNHPATNVVITVGSSTAVNANVALSTSAPQAALGSQVTFTATVTGPVGVATGSATFQDNGVTIGVVNLVNGVATFATSTLPSGPNSITVLYSGDVTYNPGMAGPLTETIGAVPANPTTTTLTASAPSAALGNNVTFTATIMPGAGGGPPITGVVTFLNGAVVIGTANVQPNGTATLSTGALPAGMDAISASYSGDIVYGSSVSNTLNETIGATPGSVVNLTLLSTSLTVAVGAPVTFTANVRPVMLGPVPTGSVTFFLNGTTVLGTQPVQNIGTAVFTTNTLPAGMDIITATYNGDTMYNPANSLPLTETVGASSGVAANTTDLKTSNPSVPVGKQVTFTATVTPMANGSALPTGTITFLSDGIAFGVAQLLNGTATLSTSTLPQGLNIITAVYSGDANYAPSSSVSVNETVGTIVQTSTFTSLVTSNPLVNIGGTAMLTATVTAAGGGAIPTGTVSFLEGTATMGSALLQPDGTATFNLPILMAAIDDIRATYDGAVLFSASTSAPISETVGPATPGTTGTTLTASTGVVANGGSVVLTAAVVPALLGGAIPTGTVSFFDGATLLATNPVQSDGTAVLTTTTLAAGINNITATYNGDTVYMPSSSPAFTVAVGAITPTYTSALNVSTGSAPVGGPVVFTATITPSTGAAAPTGAVTFFAGTAVLGTAVVQTDGTATFTTSSLPSGTATVTAIYSGSTGVSDVSPAITEMVSSLPPSLSLPTVSGQSIPTGAVVAGQPTKISLPVTITNTSMAISTGTFTLNIYLNTTATLDGHEILAGTGTRFMYLNPTASSKPWKFLLKSLPANVPSGLYHIIIQSVDPNGSTAVTTTAQSIQVVAPLVSLAATATAVTPSSLQIGENASIILTLTNNGNVAANGALSIVLSLSADGITPLSVAGTILAQIKAKAKLQPHQTRTFRVHFRPGAMIPAGTYFPYASISLSGFSAMVVGKTAFTVA